MIRSFRSKALRRFVEEGDASKVSVRNIARLETILRRLNVAERPEEMNWPGLFLHALRGADRGRYSVRVTGNYRITFAWDGKDAIDVDLEDYH